MHSPEADLVVPDPDFVVEGVASDDEGVHKLILTVAGREWPVHYVPGPEIRFRAPVVLEKGDNPIRLEAVDRTGNRTHVERTVNWPNAPGRAPEIEVFQATPAVATPGGEYILDWRVRGTRPITLELYWPEGGSIDGMDVTEVTSLAGTAPLSGNLLFLLHARNAAGADYREVFLGVGEDLDVWPREATLPPGARQRLEVRNATDVRWEADGGRIVEVQGSGQKPVYAFQAEEPGVYTVTARTDSPLERSASLTIRVVESQATPTTWRGIGGHVGKANGWNAPSPVMDLDGSLLLAGGYRYRPDSDTWFEDKESLSHLQMTRDGRLYGASGNTLFVRSAIGDFEPVATGWPSDRRVEDLRVGADGSLLAMVRRPSFGEPRELWIVLPDGSSTPVDIPGDPPPLTATTGADGTLVVAIQFNAGAPLRIYLRDPAGEWRDLGVLPAITDRFYDLLYTSTGKIFVSGRRLMVWDTGDWREYVGGLPTCRLDHHLCGIFDLHERQDGTILAVSKTAVHELGADGSFRQLGQPFPWMDTGTGLFGAMRAILEAPDGTLYLIGDTGVFFLVPGTDEWRVAGDRGLPPNNLLNDLLVDPDGSLVVTGGGWDVQPGSHSLFRRQAGSTWWEPFGDDIGEIEFPDSVLRLARDRAGNVYAWTDRRGLYKIDAQTGSSERLPLEGFTFDDSSIGDFAVASDGSLYVATRGQVFRLAPGAASWKPFSGLPCATAFLQGSDGSLWAATCQGAVQHTGGTNWRLVDQGLPVMNFSNLYANDIARGSDGSLLLATENGTFRLPSGSQRWQRLGVGEPSVRSERITSGGGRTWVIAGDRIYELDESGTWVPIDSMPRLSLHSLRIFQATPQGTLLLSGAGLLESQP